MSNKKKKMYNTINQVSVKSVYVSKAGPTRQREKPEKKV